jgi:hypothetical protein
MNVRELRSSRTGRRAPDRERIAQRRLDALAAFVTAPEPASLENYFRTLAQIDGTRPQAFGRAS